MFQFVRDNVCVHRQCCVPVAIPGYLCLPFLGEKMPINQEKLTKLRQQKEKAQIGGKVGLCENGTITLLYCYIYIHQYRFERFS